MTVQSRTEGLRSLGGSAAIFLLFAATGLWYVKWYPYYRASLHVLSTHFFAAPISSEIVRIDKAPVWEAALSFASAYGQAVWRALILGVVLGAGVQVMLPQRWILQVLGKRDYWSVSAGGLAAVPSMMCSCCAAPIAIGLREAGASVPSALAYWLGNPILNPATLTFTGLVLGWQWMMLRLIFGAALVFGVVHWASSEARRNQAESWVVGGAAPVSTETVPPGSLLVRWLLECWKLSIGLVPEFALLVLGLGATRAWLFPEVGPGAAGGIVWIVCMAVAGTFFIVPTAGEVPVVQALRALGLGAGPAAALLITLPALSLPSLVMVAKAFPSKVLFFITAAVTAAGLLAGLTASLFLT